MNRFNRVTKLIAIALIAIVLMVSPALGKYSHRYEIWRSDQSNSVSGIASPATNLLTEFRHFLFPKKPKIFI